MRKFTNLKSFTLIELVILVLIVGIIAAVTIVSMPDMALIRVSQVAFKIQSDIRYTQRLAMNTQHRTAIIFNALADTYSVYIENTYGAQNWQIITDPVKEQPFTVSFTADEFRGVDITLVYFNEIGGILIFDEKGIPYGTNGGAITPLDTTIGAGVRLNNNKDIRLTQNTGLVSIHTL